MELSIYHATEIRNGNTVDFPGDMIQEISSIKAYLVKCMFAD